MTSWFARQSSWGFAEAFPPGGFNRAAEVEAARLELEISLEEAFRGARRTLVPDRLARLTDAIEVRVPPGADTGWQLQLPGLGGFVFGVRRNLLILVKVRSHERFRRSGDNLETDASVALTTAVLGGKVAVQGIAERVEVEVEPQSEDFSLQLPGLGMPRSTSRGRGDLTVQFKVRLPESLGQEEQRIFEELRRSGL